MPLHPRRWTVAGIIRQAMRTARLDHETVFELLRDPAPMLLTVGLPAGLIAVAVLQLPGPIPAVPLAVTLFMLMIGLTIAHAMFQRIRGVLASTAEGLPRDTTGMPRAWDQTPMTHALILAVPLAVFAGLTVGAAIGFAELGDSLAAWFAIGAGLIGSIVVIARVVVAPFIAAEEPDLTTKNLLTASLHRTRTSTGRLVVLLATFTVATLLVAVVLGVPTAWTVMMMNADSTSGPAMPLLLLGALLLLLALIGWILGLILLVFERALTLVWVAETGGAARLHFARPIESIESIESIETNRDDVTPTATPPDRAV